MPTDNNYWGNPPVLPGNGAAPAQAEDSIVNEPIAASAEPVLQGADSAQSYAQPYAQQAPAAQTYAQPAPAAQTYAQPAPAAQGYARQGAPYANAAQFGVQQPVQNKSHGWIIAIVVIACLFLFAVFAVKSCTEALESFNPYGLSEPTLDEDAVAIINISGTIQYDDTACSPEGLKELLDEAEDDDYIKAVVLRVDSGGGTATAGEEMAEYVRAFSKPIVVSSASINASAAYEISSQADYIFVAKSTEIGAIGTALQLTDMSGLLDMLGINMEVITSAEEKDSSYGFRPLTDEERAYYQNMVDEINEVFIENVAEGRKMTIDEVKELATGMPFTGVTAVANGLADEVGTREDAVAKAAELAEIEDYTTIDLTLSSYDLSSLSYLLGKTNSSVDVLDDLLDSRPQ